MRNRAVLAALLAVVLLGLQGCASVAASDPRDPWEGANRKVYAFNERLDEALLQPTAKVYANVLPSFVRTGVRNFMGNLGDVWTALNAGLQLKGTATVESLTRVALNSTLGLYGVLDIASEAGIQKRKEDFGQTLGHWGVQAGPYMVLPVLGPSTLRDTSALPLDVQASPSRYFSDRQAQTAVTVLRVVDTRANLLQASDALKAASLDPYTFVRDAWLQKRQYDVHDGNPPVDFDYTDPDAP